MQFKDEYRARLLERIRAKAHGKTIEMEPREEKKGGEVVDLMEALRRSLEGGRGAAKKRAAPKRATARRRNTAKKRKAS
jgi:DNA end-binding protein Ku